MKTCPQCGFHHIDTDERCIRCGAYLSHAGADVATEEGGAPREKFKFKGGETPGWRPRLPGQAAAWARRRLFFLRRVFTSELPTGVYHRSPWLAVLLSIVPGLGQVYNHQYKKALWVVLGISGCIGLALATITEPYANWILAGCLAVLFWSFTDALVTAKKINQEFFIWQHGVAWFCAWLFYVCVFCTVFQYVACHFLVQFRFIGHDVLAPHLRQGDRVVVRMTSHPRVGDVILYNPRRVGMEIIDEIENRMVSLKPWNMIERVVAGPGQTIERREGLYYRDGRPVPLHEEPLLSDSLPMNFKMTAPGDGYIVMYSYTFGKDWMTGMEAPKLFQEGMIMHGWAEACVVYPKEIVGRVWAVYNPPENRRMVK